MTAADFWYNEKMKKPKTLIEPSCSVGKAYMKLSEEDKRVYELYRDSKEIKSTKLLEWLNEKAGTHVRERMMQRHRNYTCACLYKELL